MTRGDEDPSSSVVGQVAKGEKVPVLSRYHTHGLLKFRTILSIMRREGLTTVQVCGANKILLPS